MAKELEKIGYIVTPAKPWNSGNSEHLKDAKERAQEAVESLFAAVKTENPGDIGKLRIGGLRKRC
jgi:hypothetical protein